MSRVVIGPYRAGISLKELFSSSVQTGSVGDGSVPDNSTQFQSVDIEAMQDSVFLTKDWASRKNHWDWENTKLILVTENEMKEHENGIPLKDSVLQLFSKKRFVYGPDSLEEEDTSIEIARMKAIVGLLNPVKDSSPKEVAAAVKDIGAKNTRHVLYMAEDRELILPDILKESKVWNDFRDLPLIESSFKQGEAWPGIRINELVNACGGAVNFLLLLEESKAEMRSKGHEISDFSKDYVSYYIRFLEYDPGQPIPEEGIFISASEKNRKFRGVTQKDIDLEKKHGAQLELDDFDIASSYQGLYDADGSEITISKLRADRGSQYFENQFYAARAMRAFSNVMGIPKTGTPRMHKLEDLRSAKLISNLNLGEFAGLESVGNKIGRYQRLAKTARILSHEDIENAFLDADGSVVESWPKAAPKGVNQELYTLERKLIARMMISNRATLKPLGDESAVGRPILIHKPIFDEEMEPYKNAAKFKTVTARSEHVYRVYSDIESFSSIMEEGQWDKQAMRKLPEKKPYKLFDSEQLHYMLGGGELGFVEAFIGSASTHLKSGNDDAHFYSQESAKKSILGIDGGASRYIMGKFQQGRLDSYKESYKDFLSLGVRVPLVSRKEGSVKPLLRENNMRVEYGDFDADYMSFGGGKFHFYTTEFIGERQHLILGPAHVVSAFIGGSGTEYEYEPTMYHNLMVDMRGFGIFPGFENDQKKRIHFINSKVKDGGNKEVGYYDRLKESFTPRELEILNVHFYDTPEEALIARDAYAKELGFDLDVPMERSKKNDPDMGVDSLEL